MVGLTGRSGSGKSRVAAHYAGLGYPVADGDAISRQVTQPGSPCLAQLAEAFGDDILLADGSLDRRLLGHRAFATPQSNARLIAITHPPITAELLRRALEAEAAGARLFFIDGAMIVGGPVQPYCDALVVMTASEKLSISRIILRDGISKTAAGRRLDAQPSVQALLDAADYVIDNNAGEDALIEKADAVLAQLLGQAGAAGEVRASGGK